MVSATTYTLVGVLNKFITVLLNVILWDKHSTPAGLVGVCICLLAGVFYQQAPMRGDNRKELELMALSKQDQTQAEETQPLTKAPN